MESKKQAVNSFIKGMDKDIDISLMSKESYIDARNFRLVTSTGNTSMSLETVDGNTIIGTKLQTGYYVVGYCNVRNNLIVFTTNNTNSKILKSIVTDGSLSAFGVLYSDISTPDGSLLNLNTSYPVQAIGRYETSLIQKVYFTDGINNLRFFNLSGIGFSQPVNQFDIIPNFTLDRPQIQGLTYGSLPAGKIQYAYQLYNQYGAESLFSPCSELISLSNGNSTASTNKLFVGDVQGTNSGRGVSFTIPTYTGFTKIRVISILYTQLNGIPSINIIAEENLPNSSSTSPLSFTDFGTVSLGTYTLEEIAVIGRYLFSAQTIETKDNYLFAGNINQQQWDVTFDARAYRFVSSTAYGNLSVGYSAIWNATGIADYDIINSSFNLVVAGTAIPPTHDAINPYNNVALDGTRTDGAPLDERLYNFAYQRNGTTLGGEGPNVSYKFTTSSFTLDNNSAGNEMTVSYPYGDFSNPLVEISSRGYQRDEIYRFGIVFYDSKGRQSTVKWIGDIRFPNLLTNFVAAATTDSSGYISGSQGNNVGITFTISNLGSIISNGASYYQIVRCKRTSTDKTIIAQGLTFPLHYRATFGSEGADTYYMHQLLPDYNPNGTFTDYDPKSGATIDYSVVEFISPEANINQNIIYFPGDRLDVIGMLGTVSSYQNGKQDGTVPGYLDYKTLAVRGYDFDYNSYVYKYYNSVGTPYNQYISINNIYLTDPITNGYNTAGLNINKSYLYKSEAEFGSDIATNIGTKLVINLNSNISPSYLLNFSYNFFGLATQTIYSQILCNYRRMNGSSSSIITSQYGGNSYYDRENCSYIVCSEVAPCVTGTSTSTVFDGDTYVCMYDYLRNIVSGIFATTSTANGDRSQLAMYFPVETGINLRYRNDISFSKTVWDKYNTRLFMTEQAGTYGSGLPFEYTQTSNLYQYNSVYSQENTTISFFPKNDNITYGNQLFDSRIVVSDKKINGEESDSWLQFEVNNFLDIDTGYGSINSLLQFNDHLFFFQDNAFGDVSVSPRSLLSDNNPGALVLGTGAVLDRYDYISTTVGNKFKFGNVIGQNGIYWYDVPSKTIYNYSGSTKPLSKLKGLFSYLNQFGDNSTTCITGYDYKYNEVLFSLTNGSSQHTTFSYSELADSFISFYDFNPQWYVQVYNKQFYTVPLNSFPSYGGNSFWLHNAGPKSAFYGYDTSSTDNRYVYSSTLTFTVNDDFQRTKVFDSIQYNTKSKVSNGNDNFADTFNYIQCWNTKQNTGITSIVVDNPSTSTLTLTDNTFKREEGFITTLPRNIVNSASYANVNIFSSSNWDSSRSFQERLRDKYLIVQLAYTNNNNYAFSVPFITTNYRVSIR